MELAGQIAVHRPIPDMEPNSLTVNASSSSISMSAQQPQHDTEDNGLEHGDIVQDAQLF